MFFSGTGYSANFLNPGHHHGEDESHNHARDHILSSAFAMDFVNSNKHCRLTAYEAAPHYLNFHSPRGSFARLRAKKNLRYDEIYPGIDIHYRQKGQTLKYDFLLQPGANASQIKMHYRGLKSLKLKEGSLIIEHGLGQLVESIPLAYQIINGRRTAVDCNYTLKGDTVSLSLGDYNSEWPLIIDPVLDFATFSGSGDLNFGNSATEGENGSSIVAGVNFGANYPVTLGAFQRNFAGDSLFNVDVVISKFSQDGSNLIYSTYLGGQDVDLVHSIISDDQGNLFLFGSTGSNDFPVTRGTLQSQFAGGPKIISLAFNDFDHGIDAYLAKLSADGSQLLSATYWGGAHTDGYNVIEHNYGDHFRGEISLAPQGNLAVIMSTHSPDLPMRNLTNGAKGNQSQDAAVALFKADMSEQIWSSFHGGSLNDAGYGIRIAQGRLHITGSSASNDLPVSANALQNQNAGGLDGYLASFDLQTGQRKASTYLGSNGYDQSFLLDIDDRGGIYVFGQSKGQMNTTPGKYGVSGATQFISKLDSSLSQLLWQSTPGSGQNKQDLVPTAFMVDQCHNIYLVGWNGKANVVGSSPQNGNTRGLPVTADAFQSTTDGSDFYLMVLNREARSLLYASYLGGADNEHVDGGISRFSKDGTVYQAVCSNCNNRGFPTTPTAYAGNSGTQGCNMAVFKFTFDKVLEAEAKLSYTTDVDSICDALVVNFENTSVNATNFQWILGNGDTSSLFEPRVIYDQLGTYQVKMLAFDTICGITDSVVIEIDHLEANFPTAVIESQYESCDARQMAAFNATESNRAQVFSWLLPDGQVMDTIAIDYQFKDEGPHKIKLVALDTVCNRSDTAETLINFTDTIPEPGAWVRVSDCSNGIIDLDLTQSRPWYQYEWESENQFYKGPKPVIRYDYPGRKRLIMRVEDTICNRSYQLEYQFDIVDIMEEIYIPNAFTPNGDGLNENFKILGDPCESGNQIRIFNRWGEMVFATEQPFEEFWDGRIHGQKKAPAGVYSYILRTPIKEERGTLTLIR